MKRNQLLILVVIAAVLVALAFLSTRQQRAAPPSAVGKPLLHKLAIESVARVEIARSGAPVTIVRGDAGWAVTNLFGYPADVSKLQTALLKLAELKIGEVARGVNIDTNATLVDLQGASGKPLTTLRLGARPAADRPGSRPPQGRLVAVAGNEQVYRVKDGLEEFDGDPRDWVSSQLLSIPSSDIRTIELASPTGGVLSLSRESGTLQLQGIATNEEFEAGKSYGVESAFSYLTFSGVADPKLGEAQAGLATPHTYRVTLKNGDLYTARIGAAAPGGDRYLRLEAQLAPPGTNATAQAEQATRKAELEQKFARWTYLVPATTAENMTRTRAELVKPRVAATNATATSEAPTAPGGLPE
ncbi:MAG: DUF4340 domain-containing protein [bacterium]